MPSIAELRAVCQKSAEAPPWTSQSLAGKFTRFFSIYLTWVAIRLPFTPNQVTVFGTVVYFAGATFFLFQDLPHQLLGVSLIVLSYVIDGVDGELARYRKMVEGGGVGGVYVEPVSHDIMYAYVFLPMGLGLTLATGSPVPLTLAFAATVSKLLYRMLEMRYATLLRFWAEKDGRTYGVSAAAGKVRSPTTWRFFVFRNLFTGTGMVLPLLVATLVGRVDLFLWAYTAAFLALLVLLFAKQSRAIVRRGKASVAPASAAGNTQFETKWRRAGGDKRSREEWTVFVPAGAKPRTQRQFSLFWYGNFVRRAIRGRGYRNGVELGCGRGTAALYLNRYDGLEMTLTDVSEDAVALARENFAAYAAPGTFVVADSQALPFADASFDMIVTIGLLEHFEDYRKVLAESHRILRPGGMLVSLDIPKKRSVQDLNKVYRALIRPFRRTPPKPDYYRNADTPERYAARARAAGFAEVSVTHVNPFPLFVPVWPAVDRAIALLDRGVLWFRRFFRDYPFETGPRLAQAHFLVCVKR